MIKASEFNDISVGFNFIMYFLTKFHHENKSIDILVIPALLFQFNINFILALSNYKREICNRRKNEKVIQLVYIT